MKTVEDNPKQKVMCQQQIIMQEKQASCSQNLGSENSTIRVVISRRETQNHDVGFDFL